MAYTKDPFIDSLAIDKQLEYYKGHPNEARQEIDRAVHIGGNVAVNWANQLWSGLPSLVTNPYTPVPVVVSPVVTYQPTTISTGDGNTVTTTPTGRVDPVVQNNTSARDQRIKEMNNNVWSNDTTIAVLEKKAWAIYVDTGRWDSPEQIQYHDQSEAIRKGLNPLYPASRDGGKQNEFILPTDQFVTANGMDTKGLLTYGALGLGAVMILSMFRR